MDKWLDFYRSYLLIGAEKFNKSLTQKIDIVSPYSEEDLERYHMYFQLEVGAENTSGDQEEQELDQIPENCENQTVGARPLCNPTKVFDPSLFAPQKTCTDILPLPDQKRAMLEQTFPYRDQTEAELQIQKLKAENEKLEKEMDLVNLKIKVILFYYLFLKDYLNGLMDQFMKEND